LAALLLLLLLQKQNWQLLKHLHPACLAWWLLMT
jgi:hypothetical protein